MNEDILVLCVFGIFNKSEQSFQSNGKVFCIKYASSSLRLFLVLTCFCIISTGWYIYFLNRFWSHVVLLGEKFISRTASLYPWNATTLCEHSWRIASNIVKYYFFNYQLKLQPLAVCRWWYHLWMKNLKCVRSQRMKWKITWSCCSLFLLKLILLNMYNPI